jgi:hypothetical protein
MDGFWLPASGCCVPPVWCRAEEAARGTMRDLDERVSFCLGELEGPNREDAWHWLQECGPAALPHLYAAFRRSTDTAMRSVLVELAWQTRSSQALPFLAEALADHQPGVWKEALDGLVALGGEAAKLALRDARGAADAEKADRIDDALQQVDDSGSEDD